MNDPIKLLKPIIILGLVSGAVEMFSEATSLAGREAIKAHQRGSCLLLAAYTILDNGITSTYMKVGYEDTIRAYNSLAGVFPKNYSKKDLVCLLRKLLRVMPISEEKTKVRSDAGIFHFGQDEI